MALPSGRRGFVDDFPSVTLGDLKSAAGGRRLFRQTTFCEVELPDGRHVHVQLVKRPATLGGYQVLARCPTCGKPRRVLRVVPDGVGLACSDDLRSQYSAKYLSQVR